MSITHVTIYNEDGEAETHTRLNAVDLVRNNGYTYKYGKTYTPVDSAAYAQAKAPANTPEPAHAVLASVGSGSAIGAMDQPVTFNAPIAETTAPVEEVFDAGKEEEAPVVATESKPARRGRPSKAQLEAEAAAAAGE
ncbi:hypothetical protein HOU03_gp121 [Caulobacter phage CcrSC]|uniref:Uncharacterized protein n=1 Tax=Caulobacter phage CcrSC TaxID=2283272 RepID=A0A385ED44_9CAUD|nr:hypothetical protein HOU03_gp121 [Caulobacter phage CcrSC]AXQ69703.1 hypothetical protein CcrSC_gp121 [Caulobacter phage CcrSC]